MSVESREVLKMKISRGSVPRHLHFATLAQLVEQRFCKAKVVSSNLTGGSLKIGFSFLSDREREKIVS